MNDTPIPQSVLDASGVVGTWAHDHWTGRLVLSDPLAERLGFEPAAAAAGLPLQAFLDRIHPDDRGRIENYFHAAATGGPVDVEFRTCDTEAGARTLLLRGRVEGDGTGQSARGRGIVIDRTDSQDAGLMQAEQIVNRMAEHVITLRSLARALHRPGLVEPIDYLMIEIGFELARFLPQPEEDACH